MGKLFYFVAAILALWLIKSYFGFWVAAGVVCVLILARLWKKRADILVMLASQAIW